jgi:Galactose oxidase-like, Early set domain/PKD domain
MRHASIRTQLAALLLAAFSGRAGAQSCPNETPHLTGVWTTLPYQMPINPISATLLHTGKILIIAGSENDASNNSGGSESYRAAIWDPTGTTSASVDVKELCYDVFCSGTAVLPDGRALVVGGTADYSFKGDNRASFVDPTTEVFAQSQNMADGRWYATATALGDGRIMAFSGLGSGGGTNTKVQIYDLANAGAGWGSAITEPFTPPLFPRTFLLPDGRVFFTSQGAGSPTSNAYFFDPVAKTWTISVHNDGNRQYGSAVMLPLLPPSYTPRVMLFGGGNPATRTTAIINPSAGSPAWSAGPMMSTGRIEMNATLLPNGTVLAEGGSYNNEAPDAPGKAADLYDPVSGTMSSGGTAAYSRLYHSTAVLLPDATVASMGSNPGDRGRYESAIEIYTPPYLFDANDDLITTGRPVINGLSSGSVGYGSTLSVDYTSTTPISSAVLVRPGSATHASDMEQRLIGLCGPSPQPACAGAGTLDLTMPANGNIAPPGYYMLFLLDGAGVPSVARFVQLTTHTTVPPSGVISTPASDRTITAGQSVSFGTTTSAAKYSWVFPGGSPATSTAKNPGSVSFASPGMYMVTMTALDASNNSDPQPPVRVVNVLPSTANFSIEVDPSAAQVYPGGSAHFTVTVTPESGFTGTVNLAVGSESGFPSGISSGGFSPSSITGGSGSSTLTMNTGSSTVPYALSLTVTGTSGTISHTASTTLLIVLAAPQNPVATPSDQQVAISWESSSGTSSYTVGRSLASGGPYRAVGCTTGTAFTDTGLDNGTTYYYVVNGSFSGGPNAGGASPASEEMAAMPPCPVPAYVGSLTAAKAGGTDVSWSWTQGGAGQFDLLQGDLGALRSSGGDFTSALNAVASGQPVCLVNDTASLSLVDSSAAPAPGAGMFALLRPVVTACPAHGTFGDGSPSLVASRDPGIAASARACP